LTTDLSERTAEYAEDAADSANAADSEVRFVSVTKFNRNTMMLLLLLRIE
jgi:hypothetical protein